MRTPINFFICAFIAQFAIGCASSLPEQCKQIQSLKNTFPEAKDIPRSKQAEIQSEFWKEKSKSLDKIQVSDSNLKAIQQRLVKNYEDLSKFTLIQSSISKQQELSANDPPSLDNAKKQGDIADQLIANSKNFTITLTENAAMNSDLKKICSSQ